MGRQKVYKKNPSFSSASFSLYLMETHKDKRHTHAHMFPSCYQDILQLLGDWVICLCVCVLLRQLATAILQEWTLTFDSITADWIGSPPHCWTAAQHHSLQWHTQGHTLPIVTPSAFPLSIHVNICITYVFSSIAFFLLFLYSIQRLPLPSSLIYPSSS